MDDLRDEGQKNARPEEMPDAGDPGRDSGDAKTAGEAAPEPVALEEAPPEATPAGSDPDRDPEDGKTTYGATPEQFESENTAPLTVESSEVSAEQAADDQATIEAEDARLMAVLEAIVYVADEPLALSQIANALRQPPERVEKLLERIFEEYAKPHHGLTIREVAGGYKMTTKPEHHEDVRQFVKNLNPPLKLSMAALETLAVIAYKQPLTAPEIMEIRGVQGAGVLKTLLDRKLITTSGRKNVVGKPILYKTTKDFLVQFGLKDLSELPSLKEFEELRRLAFSDTDEAPIGQAAPDAEQAVESEHEPPAKSTPEEEVPAPESTEPPAEQS